MRSYFWQSDRQARLGSAARILLPLTFNMDPTGGIIMLAGTYYGARYGGSTTSILLNMPGEASSVVSCIDGVALAGAYGASGNMFDIGLLIGFGLLGFLMAKFGFPSAPLVLGFVLGDAMERALRQSMAMSEGDPTILVARPISAFLLAAAFVILVSPLWRNFRRARARRAAEQNAASPTLPQR